MMSVLAATEPGCLTGIHGVSDVPLVPERAVVGRSARTELRLTQAGAVLRPQYQVFSLALSPDGTQVAAGGIFDLRVTIWQVQTGRLLRVLRDQPGMLKTLAYSPDGRLFASGRGAVHAITGHHNINVWDARTGALVRNLAGSAPPQTPQVNDVEDLAFSPDGRYLAAATGGVKGVVEIRDVSRWDLAKTLRGEALGKIHRIRYSQDGRFLASGHIDGTLRIWDLESGQVVRRIDAHADRITALAYSPDGRSLASGTNTGVTKGQRRIDDPIKVWDTKTGALLATLAGHTGPVQSLAYTPDGSRLVSGSEDGTIRIWNPSSRALVQTLAGHSDPVYAIAVSQDGKYLVSGGGSTVKVWKLR